MGELAAWWGTASIAFVGGSLTKRGGQNMIEPAAYGAAVSFGPHTQNFRDVAGMMLDSQAAQLVRDGQQMTAFIQQCLQEPQYAEELGKRARQLVLQHRGAAEKTCRLLDGLLGDPQIALLQKPERHYSQAPMSKCPSSQTLPTRYDADQDETHLRPDHRS
jgi:3-deoxy-D-manno-octulosonic-acid transferase